MEPTLCIISTNQKDFSLHPDLHILYIRVYRTPTPGCTDDVHPDVQTKTSAQNIKFKPLKDI
ncbi:hypothetical protein [Bacteroides sedimenti]|uniref:hypothetical protein n=1 Tax=Bacteroides sedimenti TaxID=2136147 RepID=UPI00333E34EE